MVKSLFNLTYYCFISLCLSLSFPLLALSSLQSQVDKNPALAGEAITLTVTADARLAADALNYRHLEQHFRVMVPSVSQSTQVINGVSTQSTRWTFTLFPLASGTFTIPAFEINGLSSDPIALTVLAQSASTDEARELFVEATLQGSSEIYVQQMLYYDVVIYFSGDLQRGNLTEPQLEGAEIQRVGQDVEGSALVNGVRYRTITRRYSITPQRSGSVTIAPPLFSGEVIERDNSRYNYFARSKTVMQEANPIAIEVKPQPADFTGNWLVAGLVTLTEEWQPAQSELKVGEPVTRIITLSAVDVASSQLPDLNQQLPAQLRFYQEQPQAKGAERSGRQVAQKIFTTAIIANEAGDLILPEIRLPWWNSQTNRQEVAVLPARAFKVEAASTSAVSDLLPVPTLAPAAAINPWQWNYTSSLLLVGWLLSLLLFAYMKKPQRQLKIATEETARRPFADKLLKQACTAADPKLAAAQLLLWGQSQFLSPVRSLEQLGNLVADPLLAAELHNLARQLYSGHTASWQGAALYQAWRNWRPAQTSTNNATLAPLYPH
ncbi:BatD family protein [Alishewanella longhuensis]